MCLLFEASCQHRIARPGGWEARVEEKDEEYTRVCKCIKKVDQDAVQTMMARYEGGKLN